MWMTLKKLNKGITKVLEILIVIFALIMVLSCFAQICTRLAGIPLSWSEELARYMAVWLTFIGAAYALRKKSLAVVEILYNKLTGNNKKALFLLISALTFLFCFILIWYGNAFALKFMGQQTPALKIPKGLVYYSAVVSGVVMVLFQLELTIANLLGKEEA